MNDQQIRVFLEMAETLNFTKVAQHLYLTQQAVSKYIAELELELNVVLFHRDKGTVLLTREGETYQSLFSEIKNDYMATELKVQSYRQQLGYRIRIGFSERIDPFGELWDGLCAYRSIHPNLYFEGSNFGIHHIMKAIDEDSVDMAIVPYAGILSSEKYETISIAEDDEYLYTPEEVAKEKLDNECWGLPLIQVASIEVGYFEWIRFGSKLNAKCDVQPLRSFFTPNYQSLVAEMKLHRYVTISGDRFGHIGKIPGLKKYPINIESKLYCVWAKENENPSLPDLAQHLKSYFENPKIN